MAWKISLKRDEMIEINGARMVFDRPVGLVLLDQARVVLPSGKVVEPKTEAAVAMEGRNVIDGAENEPIADIARRPFVGIEIIRVLGERRLEHGRTKIGSGAQVL